MEYKRLNNNFRILGAILIISVFFFFSFATSSQACYRVFIVSTNLESATFTITKVTNPKISYSGRGTNWFKGGLQDGTYEIVFGDVEGYSTPSPERLALIRGDDDTKTFIGAYKKYVSEYRYSVNIAAGDINGDGIDEIITGAGPDPWAVDLVRAYDDGGEIVSEFQAGMYGGYGVNVAAGDMDGDGRAEIVTGAGPGYQNESALRIFNGYGEIKADITAFDTKYGVNIAVGNLGY